MSIRLNGEKFIVSREARRVVGSGREDAERLDKLLAEGIAEALVRFDAGERPCISIADGLEEFLSDQESEFDNAPSTLATYRRRLSMFAKLFPGPLVGIRKRDLLDWRKARLGEKGKRRRYNKTGKVSRDTVNNDLKALRRFAAWAVSEGVAPGGLDLFRVGALTVKGKLAGNRHVPRARPRHDFLKILRAIERSGHEHLGFVLRGMQLFLLREEALFRLTPRMVVLPTKTSVGELSIPPLKGGVEGGIPIPWGSDKHRLILDCVNFWRRVRGRRPRKDDPLFTNLRGRSARRPLGWMTDTFADELRRVCDALGFEDFTAYQARHSIITWLQQQPGISVAAVQAAARHLRVSTQEVYSHRSGRDALPAYEAIEGYHGRRADALSEAALDGLDGLPANAGDRSEFGWLEDVAV